MFLFLKKEWISFSLNLVNMKVCMDFEVRVTKTTTNGRLCEFYYKPSHSHKIISLALYPYSSFRIQNYS